MPSHSVSVISPRAKIKAPAPPQWPALGADEKAALIEEIRQLLRARDAVLVAHYYVDADLQALAEDTDGCVADSLEMARYGSRADASTLVVCGVRFMGETAKILNPEKRVLMPDLAATCSLDEGCPADEFSEFCDAYPNHTVVVYANTSAAVKARADWMVTSGIALPIVKHLKARGEKIIWAPDKHLGRYIEAKTGVDMVLWDGACIVHEEFKGFALRQLAQQHPDAAILVHPESPMDVIEQAHVVGSTTALIKAVRDLPNDKFIIATDRGIFWKMQQYAPGKTLMTAPTAGAGATCESCAHCPWMAMNALPNLADALRNGNNEIVVEESIRQRAVVSIQRMLDFAREHGISGALPGN